MKINKTTTVALSGYHTRTALSEELGREIEQIVEQLLEMGFTTYLSGMTQGFDLFASSILLDMKKRYPAIKLMAVVPFPGQESEYDVAEKALYGKICAQCDDLYHVKEAWCEEDGYTLQGNFLVDNSSVLICYFDLLDGPLPYAYYVARSVGTQTINLY